MLNLLCRTGRIAALCLLALCLCGQARAAGQSLRIGVLQFGTVNWEVDVIHEHGLDKAHGVTAEAIALGNKNAASIALQGGEVDLIVSDWIWVSRQRAQGRDYVFYPFSNAVGGMVARPDSGISTLADLRGKRIGVAGGPTDKSWLLYRAWLIRNAGFDPADSADVRFAAPPLLNQLISRGELDAVITFWKFRAKLLAAGMQPLPAIPQILSDFGIDDDVPLLGWVFDGDKAGNRQALINGFLQASQEAKAIMQTRDAEWERLRGRVKPANDAELISIRDSYREGIPGPLSPANEAAARQVFAILAETGGKALTGDSDTLADGVFWDSFSADENAR
ncbi:ABC transporter substrate-binding protein [Granulosicoccaceae sp. 1_MG-2023]|nr:ABC transporter substrate-binding protein [Granulosicoccaceae sp. 1_MG-2023]